jgi:oligoribonuclease NrnB/cAMP/cGMP phosphodiesterase (DHH superfamily)
MEVKDYCNNIQMELNSWKARLYDVIRKIDKVPASEKQKMQGEIDGIHKIMSDLDHRLDDLRVNCPIEWESQRGEISAKVGSLSEKYEELWHYPGLGEDTHKPGA